MKVLSKSQRRSFDAARDRLTTVTKALETGLSTFNARMAEEYRETVDPLLAAYNEALEAVRAVARDVHNGQQDYFDERGERWVEEHGSEYEDWMNEWDELSSMDDGSINEPLGCEPEESLRAPLDTCNNISLEVDL